MRLLKQLYRDESGVIASVDMILLCVLLGLGVLVGIVSLRNQIVQEFGDMATAIGRLDQSYSYVGDNAPKLRCKDCWVAGSSYKDRSDVGDECDVAGQEPAGISVAEDPLSENETLITSP